MKLLWSVVGALVLTGCAVQKPVLPESEYAGYAARWAGVHICISRGDIDPTLGAQGKRYFWSDFTQVQFDSVRMDQLVDQMEADADSLTKEQCNQLAAYIAERKIQSDSHNEMVNRDIEQTNQVLNSQQNKQVFCNTVGGVTMCNNGI